MDKFPVSLSRFQISASCRYLHKKRLPKRVVSAFFAAILLSGCAVSSKSETKETVSLPSLDREYINASVLMQAMTVLNKNYVDKEKVSHDKLFNAAISGIAANLDPYSGYEPPTAFKNNQTVRDGELSGIGIVIAKPDKQYLHIINVIPDSPADKAKFLPGDIIISVDGQDLKKLNLYQCQKLLQGPNHSRVIIKRHSAGKIIQTSLLRKKIVTPSVSDVKMIDSRTGYIKISKFTLHTADEFKKAMAKLRSKNFKALVIDLRNNTGGHVRSTVLALSQLLEPGKIIMTAHLRSNGKKEIVRSLKLKDVQADTQTPIVILVNTFTASSAEIFSSALQDNKRAILIGTRTFGKGTLLNIVRLANGGALRYSSGRYQTPAGKIIEGKGIQPDFKVIIPAKDMHKLTLQQRKYAGVVKPQVKGAITDTQLAEALKQLSPKEEKTVKNVKKPQTSDSQQNTKPANDAK